MLSSGKKSIRLWTHKWKSSTPQSLISWEAIWSLLFKKNKRRLPRTQNYVCVSEPWAENPSPWPHVFTRIVANLQGEQWPWIFSHTLPTIVLWMETGKCMCLYVFHMIYNVLKEFTPQNLISHNSYTFFDHALLTVFFCISHCSKIFFTILDSIFQTYEYRTYGAIET